MALYMETTKIDVARTLGEITSLLVQAGATQINQEYDGDRQIKGIRFVMRANGQDAVFSLPARTEPVFAYLQKQRGPKFRWKSEKADREQAPRVAWRQILRWIQAQLALIETGMVEPAEVFMPYMLIDGETTMWRKLLESGPGAKLLPEARR